MKNRNKLGVICMTMGTLLILSALSLVLLNYYEADKASKASAQLLPQLEEHIKGKLQEKADVSDEDENITVTEIIVTDDIVHDKEMTEVLINGYKYVGYILFPTLELELPVISECDDTKLKTAPCRYSGSAWSDDLVIAGHNYKQHFGRLSECKEGDSIYFVDMDGYAFEYEVILTDILASTAIDEMTSGEYDLSLFTCDYSGQNRVTLRCEKVK